VRDGASWLNEYRFFPRLFVISYLLFFAFAWVWVVQWFMEYDWQALPTDQIVGAAAAAAVAGFPAIILGVLSKILKELIVSYWHGSPPTTGQGK
jgi:hypothetical protein